MLMQTTVQDIFQIGDRVCAMLIAMDEGFQRISLSTAELEATPGDMLYSKVCTCLGSSYGCHHLQSCIKLNLIAD